MPHDDDTTRCAWHSPHWAWRRVLVRPAKAAGPSGQLTYRRAHHAGADLARSGRDRGHHHAVHGAVRAARRGGEADAQGNPAPSLAESWSAGEDGLSYEFVLRKGAKFHNGDPVTAEDVKFSFERYRGAAHALLKERVASVETPDPQRVVFKLKDPWPDFITFYAVASGAGWIVPKKYVEKVGDDGFKKAPIGAGPYKFVSFTPGVELVLEAFEQYWRKTPSVKRIVHEGDPRRVDAAGRTEARRDRHRLFDPRRAGRGVAAHARTDVAADGRFRRRISCTSPSNGIRNRRGMTGGCGWPPNIALDYNTINQALTLGYSHITGSVIPENFEFYWQAARRRCTIRTRRSNCWPRRAMPAASMPASIPATSAYANLGEAALNNLAAVGIRAKLRPLERAAFFKGYADKKYKNIIQGASGAFGNAATRLQEFVVKGGAYAYGSYPEIDELFPQQAVELDRDEARGDPGRRCSRLLDEQTMYVPIWQLAFISGVGPRVGESGFGLIKGFVYTAPYEEITLKALNDT